MSSKGSKSHKGALILALTFALAMFGARTWTQIGVLNVGTAICLLYALSGWVTKKGLSIPERIGRSAILLFVVSVVVSIFAWQFRPGWHLNSDQEDGLVEVAKNI